MNHLRGGDFAPSEDTPGEPVFKNLDQALCLDGSMDDIPWPAPGEHLYISRGVSISDGVKFTATFVMIDGVGYQIECKQEPVEA